MSSVEVANDIEPFGNYLAASEEIEPPWGWDYSAILSSLNTIPNQDGLLLGKNIANSYLKYTISQRGTDIQNTATLSIINLTKIPLLVKSLDNISNYMQNVIINQSSAVSFAVSVGSSKRYAQSAAGSLWTG